MQTLKQGRGRENSLQLYNQRLLFAALMLAVVTFMLIVRPAFAVEGEQTVKDILTEMISIVGLVFSAVGVILAVYSVGQLVLAFKNEDADSKSRASTMLVVAVILIAFPAIVEGLNLVDKIGG